MTRGLGAIGGQLLVAQRPLAVVGEIGLHPLQVSEQFGRLADLVGVSPRRPAPAHWGPAPAAARGSVRALRARTNFAGLGIDTPFVGDGHRLVRIV